jgi:hypothetical protein
MGNYLQGREIRGNNEKRKEGQKGSYIIEKIHKRKKHLNDERQKEDKRKKQTDRHKQAKNLCRYKT